MKLWQRTAFATSSNLFLGKESQRGRRGWPLRAHAFAVGLIGRLCHQYYSSKCCSSELAGAAGKVDRDVSAWKRE